MKALLEGVFKTPPVAFLSRCRGPGEALAGSSRGRFLGPRLTDRDGAGRIRPIMRSFLRETVAACIVASLLPQVAAAADALHEFLEHGVEHGHAVPVDSMIPPLHGHAHSADTPEHEHSLTTPAPGSVASHARRPLQHLSLPVDCSGTSAAHGLAGVLAAGDRPANQRPTQVIPTVLRI